MTKTKSAIALLPQLLAEQIKSAVAVLDENFFTKNERCYHNWSLLMPDGKLYSDSIEADEFAMSRQAQQIQQVWARIGCAANV